VFGGSRREFEDPVPIDGFLTSVVSAVALYGPTFIEHVWGIPLNLFSTTLIMPSDMPIRISKSGALCAPHLGMRFEVFLSLASRSLRSHFGFPQLQCTMSPCKRPAAATESALDGTDSKRQCSGRVSPSHLFWSLPLLPFVNAAPFSSPRSPAR
jgi:hypothetical protein